MATNQGKRDRAILAVLVGCGLRRDEAVRLTFAHIQQRDGRWCVIRFRTVPMPAWTKTAIDSWATAVLAVLCPSCHAKTTPRNASP